MKIGHYYPTATGDHTGVVAAIAQWATALTTAGHEVVILHAGGPPEQPRFTDCELRPVRHTPGGRGTRMPVDLGRALYDIDLLVLHEAWVSANPIAALAARHARVPYVVVPHGVFEPVWMDTLKPPLAPRKAMETAVLKGAAAVHVFFPAEIEHVRLVQPAARFVVAPTGFEVPAAQWQQGGDYLAWYGRYSVDHKGLDLLLHGLAAVPAARRPRLKMRGVDFLGGFARTQQLIAELGLVRWVDAGGPVWGTEKTDFVLGSAGFLHPSRWDCHPGALAETLALGVPCLASDKCYPSSELDAAGAALISGLGAAELGAALVELAERGREFGPRGRAFVAEHLAWETVTADYLRQLDGILDTAHA